MPPFCGEKYAVEGNINTQYIRQ